LTVVLAVAEALLPLADVTPTLFVITVPDAAVTFTMRLALILDPTGCEPSVQVTVPVAPCAGEVQLPGLTVTLWNVVPAGSVSVIATALAASGPVLPLEMV
jgi:hypothetical protein